MPQVRIYIQEVIKKNKYIYLEKEKIHYLKNVMRKRTGDNILVFNDDEEWLSKCFFEDKFKLNPEKLLRNNFLEKHSEQELFYTQQKIWKINLDYLDTVRP